jgi:creatinine amidohydrolase/Fe(II)-dependent formamide hydrolase-like protein
MKKLLTIIPLVILLCFTFSCQQGDEVAEEAGRVFKLEELSYTDVDDLDREKTIFFMTFGNLEEHGPHLPLGSDYFQAIGVRDRLISRLYAVYSDYNFVSFPVVPIGEGGAGGLARQFDHIGDFMVRFETLRNLAIDLGVTIARKGFQNIFIIHSHGGPLHNVAFNDAAAFVSETYNIRMIHITGLVFGEGFYSEEVINKYLGEDWLEKYGMVGHACAAETSANLYLCGNLVKPVYKDLPPFVTKDFGEFLRAYERADWQGYWNAPAQASKEMGKELVDDFVERSFRIAQKALAGEDLSTLPVYPANMPPMPESNDLIEKEQEIYANQKAQIEKWLKKGEDDNAPSKH